MGSAKVKLQARRQTIFISHAFDDLWIARHIAQDIEAAGKGRIRAFLDAKHIEAGTVINEKLRRELRNCSKLLVLLSSRSVNREWVLIEIGAAWGLQKEIVAVMDKIQASEIPKVIADYKAIDLNDLDKYVAQIVK